MSFPILPESAEHLTEDLLEEYIFECVGEPELARMDEHLSICIPCQNRLEEVSNYITLIKFGTRLWERDQELARAKLIARPLFARPELRIGRRAFLGTALAAGIACAAFLGARAYPHPKPTAPSTVKLLAMRGGEFDGLTPAPAGRPLELILDGSTLPAEEGYRLEIVNQAGREIWSGIPAMAGTTLSARIAESPRPGIYWIRLYTSRGELLREFGMRVE
jgi:hypothetical protein